MQHAYTMPWRENEGWNPTKNCGTFTWKAPQFLHFTSIEEGGSNTNRVDIVQEELTRIKRITSSSVYYLPDDSYKCLAEVIFRTKFNVLIKREQSKFVCYAEREKRRIKFNYTNRTNFFRVQ